MLRNIPIQKKLLLVMSVPLVLAMSLFAILYRIGNSLDAAVDRAIHSRDVLTTADGAWSGIVGIHSDSLQLALLGTGETPTEVEARANAVREALREMERLTEDNPRQASVAGELSRSASALLDDLVAAHIELRRTGPTGATSARVAQNERTLQAVRDTVDSLQKTEREVALRRLERREDLSEQMRIALLIGGACALPVVVFFGWSLLRSMLRRMLVIQRNLTRFAADGELTPLVPARDEIGVLDRAVHEMALAFRGQQRDNEMFIYSVSHDLRSPLANVQGFSKELAGSLDAVEATLCLPQELCSPQEQARLGPEFERIAGEMRQSLHFIDLAVQRQERIIHSLLSLSRAGRVLYQWQTVSLADCLQELVASYRQRERARAVEFEIGPLPSVRGDPGALERIFDNLLDNAVKYLEPSRPGRIAIGTREERDGNAVVFVRDNGVGIASENLERVFLPFSRLGVGEGEGIGLTFVRRAVERHHGRVWIESEAGSGSTVCMRLPVARANGASKSGERKTPSRH